jgi:hypothetical protein
MNVGVHMTYISVLKIHIFIDVFTKVMIIIIIPDYSRCMTWSHFARISPLLDEGKQFVSLTINYFHFMYHILNI